MSELNVYHHELRPGEYAEFYLKYEADKVIKGLKEGAKNLILDNYLKGQEIKHHKYKRCLAMARWCEAMRGHYLSYEEPKWFWHRKWNWRWLELAEKFKEAK